VESIGKAGGLKERMAALQGKGAFGAPPPPAPKPATERPLRKPTVMLPPSEGQSNSEVPSSVMLPIAPVGLRDPPVDLIVGEQPTVEEDDNVVDDEQGESERQRRVAIAARMARLGGTRVGMAPVFGKKPTVHEEAPLQEEISVTRPHEDESSSPADDSVVDQADERESRLVIYSIGCSAIWDG
jgi:myosin tail region-interacting protein MTI1